MLFQHQTDAPFLGGPDLPLPEAQTVNGGKKGTFAGGSLRLRNGQGHLFKQGIGAHFIGFTKLARGIQHGDHVDVPSN